MPQVIQFQDFAEAFALGLTQVYEDELRQHPVSYRSWLREEQVKRYYDTEWAVSGLMTMPEKGIGDPVSTDSILKGPTKQHGLQPYALGVVIEYEAMRWEQYGIFDGLSNELAKAAVNRYNVVAWGVLSNSFVPPTVQYQTYQGDAMVSTSHDRMDGGVWSNQDAGNPGISYAGVQTAIINLGKLVNERGLFVVVQPKTLVTSIDQQFVADELFGSTYRPDQTGMTKNTIRGRLKVVTSVFLSVNPTYWWVMCDKGDIRMKLRLGDKPKLTKDVDNRTKSMMMHSYCSFAFACFDTRGLFGSTGLGA